MLPRHITNVAHAHFLRNDLLRAPLSPFPGVKNRKLQFYTVRSRLFITVAGSMPRNRTGA